MKAKRIISTLTALSLLPAYGVLAASPDNGTMSVSASSKKVTLNPADASPFNDGKFEGWGTSLCWWANRLGYSEKLTQQAADLFFSEDGLGLDIARYNLGGGDDPTHNHITRSDSAVPGYWDGFEYTNDGADVNITYDWTNDENQRNITLAAMEANPNLYIEGFSNSAPYFMTNSGCSSGASDANTNNLKDSMYDDFAEFIAECTYNLKEKYGIEFKSYSPMNEPDTNYWGALSPKQEGCHFDPGTSQSNMIIETRKALDNKGLTNVLVAGMDETDINKTVKNYASLTADAKTALGRIDTHTYSGSNRAGAKQTAVDAGKDLWMSEVDGGWNGFGLADRIILDMNGMQPSAWVLWDIVDSHKDSNFTAPDGSRPEANTSLNAAGTLWGIGMADHDTETIRLANKYYFFGQFTKYINPGDTIIASSDSTLAAYNKETGDIKIVVSNSSSDDVPYEFDLSAFSNVGNNVTEIRTNNETGGNAEHWAEIEGQATISDKLLTTTAKAGTVTTYIIDGNDTKTFYGVISGAEDDLALNSQTQLTLDTDIEGDVVWSVSGSDVADITANGLLTTKALGTVTVNAAVGGYTFSRTFNVPMTGTINGIGATLKVGKSCALSLEANISGTVVWSVSNDKIASITPDGIITGLAPGEVDIIASIDGHTLSKTIAVQLYTLSGTPSWGNDSTRPADKDDYRKAADGDLDTYFDGLAGGYVEYDYGEPFKLSEVKLAARSGNGMPERTIGGTVQASNDGITWTDLYKLTSAIPAGSYTTVTASQLSDNHAYRYYRYTNQNEMTNIAEFLLEGDFSDDVLADAPTVTDIEELTDSFEGSSNIFNASVGDFSADGNTIYASGLERFGNVFIPVKSTATASSKEAITLEADQLFRMKFDLFAGWESNGRDNTFAIKDKDGNEILALYYTGGGYNLTEVRIGGKNVLSSTAVGQCRSNPGSGSKVGANGWNASGQPYVNTMGYNKSVEITINGRGVVSVSLTGGMEDTIVSGTLTEPVSIGSIELTGNYNSARQRVVSYDNFDTDLITYASDFEKPEPTPSPSPTAPPVDLPDTDLLIDLDFDNGDVSSDSAYGKASVVGTAEYDTGADGTKCFKLNGSNYIELTDANGDSLLTGRENLIISFKVKPTADTTAWWFYAAPNANTQSSNKEVYIGALGQSGGKFTFERYKNSGSRCPVPSGTYSVNNWNDISIIISEDNTQIYLNGTLLAEQSSDYLLSSILGDSSIAYIGKANWGEGEYTTGLIDDFKIYAYAVPPIDLGDLSAVTSDISLPSSGDGYTVKWTSSNTSVISNDGKVTQPTGSSEEVTLTAEITLSELGITLNKVFNATVVGKGAVVDSFTAYAKDGKLIFTTDYSDAVEYDMYVAAYNEANVLIGVSKNTAEGSFDISENGLYTVKCLLWEDSKPMTEAASKNVIVSDSIDTTAYLFAHFVNTEGDASCEQIYFSISEDGQNWTTLNDGKPVLTSTVGELGVRDPYILRGQDGKYFIIATDLSIYNRRDDSNRWGTCQTSGSKSIVVWESDDLVNWSEASLVKVSVDNAGCTWAPEAIYDSDKGAYMVFWASKVSDDNYATQRVYRSYTTDFKTFTPAEVYIDGGNISNIDTTIIEHEGYYYRFTKNESKSTVIMEKARNLSGEWKAVDTYTLGTMTGYEGPTIYKLNGEDKWCLLLDFYSKSQGYKPFVTTDLAAGNFASANDFVFDGTYRHGTVMPITAEELAALKAKY